MGWGVERGGVWSGVCEWSGESGVGYVVSRVECVSGMEYVSGVGYVSKVRCASVYVRGWGVVCVGCASG